MDVDRSESKDLAKEHPEKLQALIKAWFEEAEKNMVLPLDDRSRPGACSRIRRPAEEPPRERYIYYPGTAPVPEGVAVNVRGRSYKILADVEITDPDCSGRDLRPRFTLRRSLAVHQGQEAALRLQLPRHQAGTALRLGRAQARQVHAGHGVHPRERGRNHESLGKTKLYVNDKVVAEGPMRAQVGKFTLSGDGLCIGYDSGDAVSEEYTAPIRSRVARSFVGVTVEKAQYLDLETLAAAAFARD